MGVLIVENAMKNTELYERRNLNMTQEERIDYLIKELLEESGKYISMVISDNRKDILRSLINIRMPKPVSSEFLHIQDEFLQEELQKKGVVHIKEIQR